MQEISMRSLFNSLESRMDTVVSKGYLFYFIFIFSTTFFVYQHSTGISRDFSDYVLNAKYLFADGGYFEIARPPLAPVIIGIFSIFGWTLAEYLYIIFVSCLFAYASVQLAKKAGIDKTLFYCMAAMPFVLNFGMAIGTELLYLSMLMLSVAYIDKNRFGFFLSFLCLAHYSNFVYVMLAFFKRNWRKIALTFVIVLVMFLPWLYYNQLAKGFALASIADQYGINIKFRDYIKTPFSLEHTWSVIGYYIFLVPFGLYAIRNKWRERNNLIILLILAVSLVSYSQIPNKEARYMFSVTLPAAYLSAMFVRSLKLWRVALIAIVIVNVLLASAFFGRLENVEYMREALADTDNCMLSSNGWVFLNYFGRNTEPYPRKTLILGEIENGKRILLFKGITEPDYVRDDEFMATLPKLIEKEGYVILGDSAKCAPITKVNIAYVEGLRRASINITHCEVLFPQQLCKFLGY